MVIGSFFFVKITSGLRVAFRARFGLWCDFASPVVMYITYFNLMAKVPYHYNPASSYMPICPTLRLFNLALNLCHHQMHACFGEL
jgi:hypothetical protein